MNMKCAPREFSNGSSNKSKSKNKNKTNHSLSTTNIGHYIDIRGTSIRPKSKSIKRRTSTTFADFSRMSSVYCTLFIVIVNLSNNRDSSGAVSSMVHAQGQQLTVDADFHNILGKCRKGSEDFDDCMKNMFNDLRAYFPTGVPQYGISPFDPHHSPFVELRRGDENGFGGFKLILRNVSEYGWSQSEVTKYHTDYENQRIIYSQYFPEKSLEGWYEFAGKMFGAPIKRRGFWNMTLYDYSQTTSVRRLGPPGSLLKVHVEVDRIGGLKMHISDFVGVGRQQLNSIADGVINSMWPIGLPFIKPIINELVSSAFTDIFNESFRHFPLDRFLNTT